MKNKVNIRKNYKTDFRSTATPLLLHGRLHEATSTANSRCALHSAEKKVSTTWRQDGAMMVLRYQSLSQRQAQDVVKLRCVDRSSKLVSRQWNFGLRLNIPALWLEKVRRYSRKTQKLKEKLKKFWELGPSRRAYKTIVRRCRKVWVLAWSCSRDQRDIPAKLDVTNKPVGLTGGQLMIWWMECLKKSFVELVFERDRGT